ncbi:MAG: hydroxymethylbilane synthase [Deltaproteobacteria bacterium]|nr:hydroxymethylbilane synthase [Deltaproteobacteria bacterium]
MSRTLKIGTRKSPLALWQAEHVKAVLEATHADLRVELVKVVTKGDKILDVPLAKVGGKALFVKEIEDQLLNGEIDLAVHSMKDVPTVLPEGLGLVATSLRADPRDAFVARDPAATPTVASLPEGARVGTSSLRRSVQLLSERPDLVIVPVRGNVGTRLSKLEADDLACVILACAGLDRLEEGDKITERIAPETMLPAIGQAALGLEARLDDDVTRELIAVLHDEETHDCVAAERAFLTRLEGSCQVPIGGYALIEEGRLWMRSLVGTLDGSKILRAEARGDRADAEALGVSLAEKLLSEGADAILAEIFDT